MMNYHLYLMIIEPIIEKEKHEFLQAGIDFQRHLNETRPDSKKWSLNQIYLWLDYKWDIIMGQQFETLKERYPLDQIHAWEKRCNNMHYLAALRETLAMETEAFHVA